MCLGRSVLLRALPSASILVAHVGKRGAGALATSALFGRLSGGFEDIVKSGGESRSKRALQRLTPERILTANKDNFPLRFGEIVGVRLVERPYSGEMTILTGDNKFEFQTQHPLDSIVGLLQIPLGPKLTVERLPEGVRKHRAH